MTVLVLGAARSGIAVSEFLLRRGARVILSDQKAEAELTPALAPLRDPGRNGGVLELELGGHRDPSFRACDLVVISPGVPAALPQLVQTRKRGIPIIAEVELAYRHLKGTIIAITGSNGKTTTTSLAAEILRTSGRHAVASGNIGTPLISFVDISRPEDIYVAELSSFQLETIDRFRPHIAAILNLTRDHMDRYARFEDYMAAKRRILMNQRKKDWAVLNGDDSRTAPFATGLRPGLLIFSRRYEPAEGCFLRGQRLIFRREESETVLLERPEIQLRGDHNLENVLAACAMTMLAGADPLRLKEAIRNFKGVEHRLEWVAEIDGVQYFNDSKATNVDATLMSLHAFSGNVLLIAGGRDKGGDFAQLRDLVREKVKHLVLIGEAADRIRQELQDVAEITSARDMTEAVSACHRLAQPGDAVLLAPACASFDMFRNYEDRGRVFKTAVLGLQPGE